MSGTTPQHEGRAPTAARKSGRRKTPAGAARGAPDRHPALGDHLSLLRRMLAIRRFEERCVELYSGARIRGFVHLCIGEEAVAVGVNQALLEEDAVVSTYREHGHALARGVPADAVMAEMYGKATGCSHGRGGSMHLFDATRRFYGGNAIVAGGLPLAAGLALADRMRGSTRVTCCFFGDGAFAEGEFHETANLAALWRLPLLLVCENNLYAMGTSLAREHAQTNLAMRAASYGMPAWTVDGMDVLAVEAAALRATESVRAGNGPHFLEAQTYRFRAHSMYDPDRYRAKSEIEEWKGRDPLKGLADLMRSEGELDDRVMEELESEVLDEIDTAVQRAEEAPSEPVTDLLCFVTSSSGSTP
ncbi:pyruvate dehydrogenase (acetyl-transferring) E1 component subunit alpha [Streptomyces sp. NBC_01264]|uniref:pyruvate dehydrogenase (acetyl-transferring) E1 component subunit alpha n=1 Tax=Streptomyces sp. NBC_01264 TaxID=2903804 RepID=UPI00224F96C7|nr:pyruvate dehydrogenase (acetyl-transferring) E1 component subunit alpha [Streptomyces sp. NBC_01264]MCX4781549.1 pyruvate dehydrogenase (acetyl-transferring) E1 component subunit alpha [Streptomyces sp. NBC_01264]